MGANVEIGRTETGHRIHLPQESRKYHLHVLGRFGHGKSKFLENLIRNDIIYDRGLCLIDPHGELYDNIVEWCAYKGFLKRRKIHLVEPSATSDWACHPRRSPVNGDVPLR